MSKLIFPDAERRTRSQVTLPDAILNIPQRSPMKDARVAIRNSELTPEQMQSSQGGTGGEDQALPSPLMDKGKRPETRGKRSASPVPSDSTSSSLDNPQHKRQKTGDEGLDQGESRRDVQQSAHARASSDPDDAYNNGQRRTRRSKRSKADRSNPSNLTEVWQPPSLGAFNLHSRARSVPVFPMSETVPHLDFRNPALSPSRSRSPSKEFEARIIPFTLKPMKPLEPIPDEGVGVSDVEMGEVGIEEPTTRTLITSSIPPGPTDGAANASLAPSTNASQSQLPPLPQASRLTLAPILATPHPKESQTTTPASPLTPLPPEAPHHSTLKPLKIPTGVGETSKRPDEPCKETQESAAKEVMNTVRSSRPLQRPDTTTNAHRPPIIANTSNTTTSRSAAAAPMKVTKPAGEKQNAFEILMQKPALKPVVAKGRGKVAASSNARAGSSTPSTLRAPTAASLAKEKAALSRQAGAMDKPKPSIKAKMKPRGRPSKPTLLPLPIPNPDEDETKEEQEERVPTPPLEPEMPTIESRSEVPSLLADKSMQDLTEMADTAGNQPREPEPPAAEPINDVPVAPLVDGLTDQPQVPLPVHMPETCNVPEVTLPDPVPLQTSIPSPTEPSPADESNVPPRTRSKANRMPLGKKRPAPIVSIPLRVTRSTRNTPTTEQPPPESVNEPQASQPSELPPSAPLAKLPDSIVVADIPAVPSPLFTPEDTPFDASTTANDADSQPAAVDPPLNDTAPAPQRMSPLPPSTPALVPFSDLSELTDVPMDYDEPVKFASDPPMRSNTPESSQAASSTQDLRGNKPPTKSRLPLPKTPSRTQVPTRQSDRKTPIKSDRTPHSSPVKTYASRTPKTPKQSSPTKAGRTPARSNASPSPIKPRAPSLGRSVSMRGIGGPRLSTSRNISNPSTLSNLTSALEKLNAPRPERPNTSMGFSRDRDQGTETDTESYRGGACLTNTTTGSRDGSVSVRGKGNVSTASRVKPASYAAPGPSVARTASAAFRNKPQSMAQKPVTAFFSKQNGAAATGNGTAGRGGRVVGSARGIGSGMRGRVGPKASKRTTLPMVEASPVKGGGTAVQRRDGGDDVDMVTEGDLANEAAGADKLFGGSELTEGTGGNIDSTTLPPDSAPAQTAKGKERAQDSWLRDTSKRASLALAPLSQPLNWHLDDDTDTDPDPKLNEISAPSAPTTSVMGPPPSPKAPGRPGLRSATQPSKDSPSSASGGKPITLATRTRARSNTTSGSPSGSTPKSTPGGTNGNAKLAVQFLKDCIVFVDVKSDTGEEAGGLFVDMLQELGARLLSRVGQTCTHIVYKNGQSSTISRWRQLRDPKPLVVGIAWVVECVETRSRAEETKFLIDVEHINVAGTTKRRRSILPKLLSRTFDHTEAPDHTADGENPEADQSMESNSSLILEDNLAPLELARRRKSIAMGSRP